MEKQVDYLDAHPDVGVVGCWTDVFPDNKWLYFPSDDFKIKSLMMNICAVVHPSSMLRKSVLIENKIRYEKEYSPAEDYKLWCSLMEFTRFYNISEVLFRYRSHDHRTSVLQKKTMREVTEEIHAIMRNKYPAFFAYYTNTRKRVWCIRLFKLVPFLTVTLKNNKYSVYLFGKIPLLGMKEKGDQYGL